MPLLEGKTAIVTGAGTGIGKAIARRFSREGAAVILCGRRRRQLEAAAGAIDAEGGRSFWVEADVTVEADIRRVVAAALAQTGRIDVLVNNAGMLRFGSLEESDPAIWEAVLRVNAFAPWRFMVAVLPAMRVAGGGAIVNISSIGGLKAFAGVGLYCTSKAALQMLSQVMALEVAADNIRVNLVCPSMVEGTEIADPMFGAEGSAEYWERIRPLHPLGRNGKPEDVADAVLFLASAQSAWMTGAILNLDGGRHLATGRPVI